MLQTCSDDQIYKSWKKNRFKKVEGKTHFFYSLAFILLILIFKPAHLQMHWQIYMFSDDLLSSVQLESTELSFQEEI